MLELERKYNLEAMGEGIFKMYKEFTKNKKILV